MYRSPNNGHTELMLGVVVGNRPGRVFIRESHVRSFHLSQIARRADQLTSAVRLAR